MKKVIALTALFIIMVISVSGCLGDDICKEIERESAKNNVTCHCVKTDIIPQEYENLSAKAKCTCLCYSDGVWVNTTVAMSD